MSRSSVRTAHPLRNVAALLAAGALVSIGSVQLVDGAAAAPQERAAAKRTVTVKAPSAATEGRPFSISGKVSKTPKGKKVVLQVRSGSTWRVAKKSKTGAKGSYGFKVIAGVPGEATYRVVAAKAKVTKKKLAKSVSQTVTVQVEAKPVQYVEYDLSDWPAFGGSAVPAFKRAYLASAVYGDYTQMAALEVGQQAWISFNMKGQCRAGHLTYYSNNPGFSTDVVANFSVKIDGVTVSTHAVGDEAKRLVELPPLTDKQVLEVSVAATGPASRSTDAYFYGALDCAAGTPGPGF